MPALTVQHWLSEHAEAKQSPIQRLFNRFDGMYPGVFKNKFSTPDSVNNWKEAWAEAFAEERITLDEVATGLRECRKSKQFPPSLPEFLACCRPPIDYDKAFCEAVDQMGKRKRPATRVVDGGLKTFFEPDVWSNPAIFWAARAMGSDLWERYDRVKARWGYELDKVLASGDVQSVPLNTGLLPAPAPSKELTAEEQKNIADMIAKVHSMLDGGGDD